eukprot:GFUD01019426.1.p1 GENE.GFUD01019426.1~~GFUD01019426.1.p1  ORF type:complete len:373 (+),score=87.58 GFUD01019426.1:79-1197(+)
MSEVWVTSALLPTHSVSINWKIDNFARWLKVLGKVGIYSPEFKITSTDNKAYSVKVKLQELADYTGIMEDGVPKSLENFRLVTVAMVVVDNDPNDMFSLAGTLDLDWVGIGGVGGKRSSGKFGDSDQGKFDHGLSWQFMNSSSTISYSRPGYNYAHLPSGFCVASATEALQLKVELATPGLMSNSISLVPTEHTVKEIGSTRLMDDMRSLLSQVDEYADFTIVCEDKNFPCHEAILRARSAVLNKMFLQKMKEATTRKLMIEDVGKDTVDVFLEYLYTGEIKKKVANESELIYIADKYLVTGLLELCFHKLPEVDEDRVVDILILADRHNLEDFKKVAIRRIMMNKAELFKDEEFVEKMKMSPHLLVELVQM